MLNRDKSDHFCKVCKKSFLEIDKPDTCTCGKPNEPQLSAENQIRDIMDKRGAFNGHSDCMEFYVGLEQDDYQETIKELAGLLATALEEQKQKYEEVIESLKGEILEMGEMED